MDGFFFLAMLSISAAYAVVRPSVRPSVGLTVTFVDSVETNKHIFNFFTIESHYSSFSVYQTSQEYSDGDSLTGASMQVGQAKIAILDEYMGIGSMTGGARTTTATVDRAIYSTDRHASLNLVYYNQHGRPRRKVQNLIVRSCKA